MMLTTDPVLLAAHVGGALVLAVAPALAVGRLLNWIAPWERVDAPQGVAQVEWTRIVEGSPSRAGGWIGRLECLVVYVAVLYAGEDAGVVIGGWLAFKLASKWETWSNVNRVPERLDGVSDLSLLKARRNWGKALYERFLVGTLVNVLAGFLMAVAVQCLTRQ